jgi:hypothetical protein
MPETIPIFVGYDPREAIAYHVCADSIIRRASQPVAIHPLALNLLGGECSRRDGSNDFGFSRFLVPWLMGFKGRAIWMDGDMVVKSDIAELWGCRDAFSAVHVVKHDYKTKAAQKYLGNENRDYPRKNWSSVIVWECGSYLNRVLNPEYVRKHDGEHMHRFAWLPEERIGSLDKAWNWLPQEEGPNHGAKLIHWTLGTPCFDEYFTTEQAADWHTEAAQATRPR